ncbi:MAG: hypothetical protein H6811_08845 [Phycisphaeraceae bacterium]|nr:hypothetical protein [Phycisphaeraceae bacterium]
MHGDNRIESLPSEDQPRVQAFMDRMWKSPPRCLAGGFSAAPEELVEDLRDNYGDFWTIFRVGPEDASHRVWGGLPEGEDEDEDLGFWQRVVLGDEPERPRFSFDNRRDGHDGESGFTADEEDLPLTQYLCPECGQAQFECFVAFEYPIDLEESLEGDDAARPQDFYTWFSLLVYCDNCDHGDEAASIECA